MDSVDNKVTQGGETRTNPAKPDESITPSGMSGHDLAHEALKAARERAKARGRQPGERARDGKYAPAGVNRRRRRWSGARPDDRDPQPLGLIVDRMVGDAGWTGRLARSARESRTDALFERWAELVGSEVAGHTKPIELRDGVLSVQADSTAWATELRGTLAGQLLKTIAAGVGHGVVKRLKVAGPTAPSWRHGPLHVPGRGPRDTYG